MSDLVLNHFNLRRAPFTVDIDVEGLFEFDSFQQGLRRLQQAARSRGAALIVGQPGTGKTALVRALVQRLQPHSYVVLEQLVSCAKAPARSVVEGLLSQLGEPIPFNNPARALKVLKHALLQLAEKQRTPVVILDDAHHLTSSCWLTLKALLNYNLDSRMTLLLIFMGGPSTLHTLNFNALDEVRDRLSFCFYLQGLKSPEVALYLQQRLRWAGSQHELFPADIVAEIGLHSQGLPRRVNRIAAACLLAAASLERRLIDRDCLRAALSELQFVPPQREEQA